MNWLVIAVIGLLAVFAYKGHRTGFIKTVFSMFSIIIVLFLTSIINPYVNKMLQNNEKINDRIKVGINKMINENETNKENKKDKKSEENKELKGNKQQEKAFVEAMPLPVSIKNILIENNNTEVHKAFSVTGFNDYITSYLAHIIINAISFGLTFIILSIIMGVIVYVLNIISKLPVLNAMNRTAGLVIGVIEGFLVIWVLCIVLTMFSSNKNVQVIYDLINESTFLGIIYNNNYLLKFITGISSSLF